MVTNRFFKTTTLIAIMAVLSPAVFAAEPPAKAPVTPSSAAAPMAAPAKPVSPFLVQGIAVDVVGESAVAARGKAFKRAQQKGFDQLAKQVLPPERAAAYKRPPLSVISPMVLDFEVTNERLSATRYLGTYAIRFSPQKVRRYFGTLAGGVASTATQPKADPNQQDPAQTPISTEVGGITPPLIENRRETYAPAHEQSSVQVMSGSILVLPYIDQGTGLTLWQNNPWIAAWSRLSADPSAKVQPIIPIGDVADLREIGERDPLSLGGAVLAPMKKRYDANAIVIAILEQGTSNSASIRLYDASGARAGYLTTLSVQGDDRNPDLLLDRAAFAVRRELSKGITTVASTAAVAPAPTQPQPVAAIGQMYRLVVGFENLAQWQDMRQKLARVPGMGGLRIASLSSASAILDAQYQGDVMQFQTALQQSGFMIDTAAPVATQGRQTVTIRQDRSTLRFLR